MNCFYFLLQKLYCIGLIWLFSVSVLLGQTVNRDTAKQLETLATHTSGVLSDIPEEIRAARSGPVTQRVIVSDDGFLTIFRRFYCKPFLSACNTGKLVKGTSMKKFALADLQDKVSCRYEINRHANTIKLFDNECGWSLGFPSTGDTELAFSLLESLIASAPSPSPPLSFSRSSAAAHAGFKYLAVTSRCDDIAEGVRLFSLSEPSPRLLCWLTKGSPQETEALSHESMNRLPLFLFDLTVLDECSFFTQSIHGNTAFLPCSIGVDMMQSAYSDEKDRFEAFLKFSPYVGICFESMPDFPSPVAILCKACDEHKIRKTAHSLKMHIKEVDWCLNPWFNVVEEAPRGMRSSWFTGLSDTSDDILRYCLLQKPLTSSLFVYTLYPEFPNLQRLLCSKSRYRKDLSLEEVVCFTSKELEKHVKRLSKFSQRVLRVALATHELGSSFGEDRDLGYNSWPIALLVAEKTGLTEKEKMSLQALIDDSSLIKSQKRDTKKKKDLLFLAFLKEMGTASEIGICLQEWLQIKACFHEILVSLGKKASGESQEIVQNINSLKETYKALLPFGIPRGMLFCQGPMETRSVTSSYLWEVRDPKHRDGLSLRRWREKYEHMLIEGTKTSWKGRFWGWLEKEVKNEPICSNCYLHEDERRGYLAKFEHGVLINPIFLLSEEEIEVMFVIDDWGRMYLGLKNNGEEPNAICLTYASFIGGLPVASAGTLTLRGGRPVGISDHSGYYRCGPPGMARALTVLEKMGVTSFQVITSQSTDVES
jgi:hypothetical protein